MPVEVEESLSPLELLEAWPALSTDERLDGYRVLSRAGAEEFAAKLTPNDAGELLGVLPAAERKACLRLLPLDNVTDIVQHIPPEQREEFLTLLDETARKEVSALLAYAEDAAGGLMNPRYVRLRPEMTCDEAIRYLRQQTRNQAETVYYGYVQDRTQRLVGVVSFRELFLAAPQRRVDEIMRREMITLPEDMDQEEVSKIFAKHNLIALPVIDAEGRMKGIVTADDIVDVVKEEATEDMQKMGGTEALDEPYLQIALRKMFRKRVIWLALLFIGQTMTVAAMKFFQRTMSPADILALFVPLIISSGGNSGSQASTLVVRALALGEVRPRDWRRVVWREVSVGTALGGVLATLGLLQIVLGEWLFDAYGAQYLWVALTVFLSLIGVVLWGTCAGSMLPLGLRRCGLDPASASTPFVATLCDVTGIMIYFGVASAILRGVMLG